ncbi:DUF58 domain-containing protein [Pseudomonas sp. NW5]|uniref:DUF58 domain-containing protein n=1 Tax=Pseudomonas sp. NW5 TaxID=2934934 RepID=UPI002020D20E|nr:DUF58 domain-containing protein [Pseudomonas sp. NW5]MCL7461716.1 DUF58 domain-containing protein [Pseudomonas sp. NW5]
MHASPAIPGVTIGLAELLEIRHHLRQIQLFSKDERRSPLIGLHQSRLRGRGVDFDQVRVYQPGDDVRTIDWRVTARTREPHTKLFHEERERPVLLLVEQSPALFFGSVRGFKSVLAAEVAALFGWAALQHNDRIGGLVFDGQQCSEVRPRRSKQSLLQLLGRLVRANQALASAPPAASPGHGLPRALRRAREILRPGSLALLIADERSLDHAAEQQIDLLAQHCDLILVPISDPLEHHLPAAGLLRFADAQCSLVLDSNDPRVREAWQQQARERQARWQRLAQKSGLALLPLSTGRPLLEQLQAQLQAPQRSRQA